LGKGLTTPHHEKPACHEILHRTVEFMVGSCEHGDEPLGSMKGGEFL